MNKDFSRILSTWIVAILTYAVFLVAITAAIVAMPGCCTGKLDKQEAPEHVDGACVHPLVNGGQPFVLGENTLFDGKNLSVGIEGGEVGILTGASCSLVRKPVSK